jgi:hypothetical protein
LSALSVAAQKEQAFEGAITDSMCSGAAGHTAMLKKGQSFADCAAACVKMGARYVLANPDEKAVYELDDQKKPAALAGQIVFVIGSLDKATSMIHIYDMFRALPPKITEAKSVYIDCDDCLRRMASAKEAALQNLLAWKRFNVVSDPHKADLVLLFSSNRYLGDYVTREGPDTRPVRIKITYMDVIDPHTGESLWSDYRRAGSFFVAGATKDLLTELRAQLEAEQGQLQRLMLMSKDRNVRTLADEGK